MKYFYINDLVAKFKSARAQEYQSTEHKKMSTTIIAQAPAQENKMSAKEKIQELEAASKKINEELLEVLRCIKRLEGDTAYRKIKHLIGHGCSMNWSSETAARNYISSYDQIFELLHHQTDDNETIMLTQKEVDSLCDYYKFCIHDVHGYYPDEKCRMLILLRSARICDEVDMSKYDGTEE